MIHWHHKESTRIGDHNLQPVICWARRRLLWSRRTQGAPANKPATNRPVGTVNEVAEHHDELVKLVTCANILKLRKF